MLFVTILEKSAEIAHFIQEVEGGVLQHLLVLARSLPAEGAKHNVKRFQF